MNADTVKHTAIQIIVLIIFSHTFSYSHEYIAENPDNTIQVVRKCDICLV